MKMRHYRLEIFAIEQLVQRAPAQYQWELQEIQETAGRSARSLPKKLGFLADNHPVMGATP